MISSYLRSGLMYIKEHDSEFLLQNKSNKSLEVFLFLQSGGKTAKGGAVLPKTVSRRPAIEILCTILFNFAVFLHFQLS